MAFGGFAGLALGAAVCMLTYFGLVRIPMRALFATTTVLIALLAAGMAAQAASFLEKANWLTLMDNVVWDSGWLLSDSSFLGRALHTLIGYTDQPTAMQLAVYLAILAVTFVLMRLYGAPAKDGRRPNSVIARSEATKQSSLSSSEAGLLRFARNDGLLLSSRRTPA